MTSLPKVFGQEITRVHLLGAGGMGMAPLGLYLAQLGFQVSAEDDGWNPAERELLERASVTIAAPGGLPEATQLVVFSSAIALTHPSRRRATAIGLPQVRRGEMLAEIAKGRKLVAVAGSHGKTTTTAMLITALQRAHFPCSWVLGGLFNDDALPPAWTGGGDWLVAEVDESDGTIDGFSPEITLVVNLDWDHPDHYARMADLEAAFAALLARTKGAVFVSDVCAQSARIVARGGFTAPVFTFGRTGHYQCHVIRDVGAGQEVGLGGRFTVPAVRVPVHGEFNAINAAAALAVAQYMGAAVDAGSLSAFAGVRRRQSVLHASTVRIYEDYAHHPTEIRALLKSLRTGLSVGQPLAGGPGPAQAPALQNAPGRLVVVFQPH